MSKYLKDLSNQELLKFITDYELDFLQSIKSDQGLPLTDINNLIKIVLELQGDIRILLGLCKEIVKRFSPKEADLPFDNDIEVGDKNA